MTNERTDHAAKAEALLSRSAQFNEPDTAEISADLAGLTRATLALVEQQRIANEQARTANQAAPSRDIAAEIEAETSREDVLLSVSYADGLRRAAEIAKLGK